MNSLCAITDLWDANDSENTVHNIKVLLAKLPPIHFKILSKLLHLLHAIATNSHCTSMGASNLAIVWTPNILKSPDESLHTGSNDIIFSLKLEIALMETPLANEIVTVLINNFPTLFDNSQWIIEQLPILTFFVAPCPSNKLFLITESKIKSTHKTATTWQTPMEWLLEPSQTETGLLFLVLVSLLVAMPVAVIRVGGLSRFVARVIMALLWWIAGSIGFFFISILFGAPVTACVSALLHRGKLTSCRQVPRTLLFSSLLSSLSFYQLALYNGREPLGTRLVIGREQEKGQQKRPKSDSWVNYWVVWTSTGTVLGAWLGAIPMPLDSDRPWQMWPISCTCGALAGYVTGATLYLLRRCGQGDALGALADYGPWCYCKSIYSYLTEVNTRVFSLVVVPVLPEKMFSTGITKWWDPSSSTTSRLQHYSGLVCKVSRCFNCEERLTLILV